MSTDESVYDMNKDQINGEQRYTDQDALYKALLVGVNLNNDPDFEASLEELGSLAEACGMEDIGVET